ncbi:DNA polymerase III subunit beta [Candidatus Vidania fulgoroideorum]
MKKILLVLNRDELLNILFIINLIPKSKYFNNIINLKIHNGVVDINVKNNDINIVFYNIKNYAKKTDCIDIDISFVSIFKVLKTLKDNMVEIYKDKGKLCLISKNLILLIKHNIAKSNNCFRMYKDNTKKYNYCKIVNLKLIECFKYTCFILKDNNILKDIYVKIKQNCINIITCDNFRLASYKLFCNFKKPLKENFYVNYTFFKFLKKVLNKIHSNFKIYFKDNSLYFKVNEMIIYSKILKRDESLSYMEMLDKKKFNNIAIVKSKELKLAIDRSRIVCSNNVFHVNLNILKNYVKISSSNFDGEYFKEKINNYLFVNKKEFCFDINFILELLKEIKDCKLNIMFNPKQNSVILLLDKITYYKYLIMPIELN